VVPDASALLRDATWLSRDALEGRATGTPGNDTAAAYVARRFAALGLHPLGTDGFFQPFEARPVLAGGGSHGQPPAGLPTRNVVGLLPGSDAALAGQYIVIGAHHDHLGRTGIGALDADSAHAIHNGADDNASGTSTVMELARLLARRPPARSVLFVTFSAEELGLLGSRHFVEHSPVPLDSVVAMLNFDMVGRLRDHRLILNGTATALEMRPIIDSANASGGEDSLRITANGDGFGPSDHSSFYGAGVPVLHFFTNLHDDYHRASDDAHRLDAAGMARVAGLAEGIARAIADRPQRLTPVRVAAPAPATTTNASNVYLGTIPDMAAGERKGLLLSGVRPGSPADSAGLRAGDLVVELGGQPVTGLYDYSSALYAHQPGDTVSIVVERDGQRLTFSATLGRRGG
jgi:hypothetical protein